MTLGGVHTFHACSRGTYSVGRRYREVAITSTVAAASAIVASVVAAAAAAAESVYTVHRVRNSSRSLGSARRYAYTASGCRPRFCLLSYAGYLSTSVEDRYLYAVPG